ncbi:hypothetical protein AVEN_177716-1 [Araneus ventricosus]|uniref:Uncharacterized protein n=1 Tax=Araneus ventricosus TaxID=182803 RepID=A0A4Y2M4V6_ARAVE|nr:hypothetical protein AVEN_177716-1 [Araneus ventricosus]
MYGAEILSLAAPKNNKKIQKKILKIITNAPWYIRYNVVHSVLNIETVQDFITHFSRKFFNGIIDNPNDLIAPQTSFTNNRGKHSYPYSTTNKWTIPLKPP